MYNEKCETYIEEMTEDISTAARLLASETEKQVPETGPFPKITVEFEDKSGMLDITYWQYGYSTGQVCIMLDGLNSHNMVGFNVLPVVEVVV